MGQWIYCRNCGRKLDGGRDDRAFCDDRCGAAFHRQRTPEDAHQWKRPGDVHQEKTRDKEAKCDQCGKWFEFNSYAERGGKRKATYCSNKCRQAAYRERKKDAAGTGQQQQQQQQQHTNGSSGRQQQQQQQPPPPPRQKLSWWQILGVSESTAWDEITRAWKKLVQQHHPDRNMHDVHAANERMKDINEAYQALKKYYGKNTRQRAV